MKLVRTTKTTLVFQFGPTEERLFREVLELYPLVPGAHHRLSQDRRHPQTDENQRLLEEALAEQRRENRKHVQEMLNKPGRFQATDGGCEFKLKRAEVEWLLQVLNDVRVGSWLALGEPEELHPALLNKANARYFLVMELGSAFQSALLEALGVGESREWGE